MKIILLFLANICISNNAFSLNVKNDIQSIEVQGITSDAVFRADVSPKLFDTIYDYSYFTKHPTPKLLLKINNLHSNIKKTNSNLNDPEHIMFDCRWKIIVIIKNDNLQKKDIYYIDSFADKMLYNGLIYTILNNEGNAFVKYMEEKFK
jgi:hypothetical protein